MGLYLEPTTYKESFNQSSSKSNTIPNFPLSYVNQELLGCEYWSKASTVGMLDC